jgi:hypothetical protein
VSPEDAVLLIGVYGSGKTSVAEEIADLLERAGIPFAAIDLDWLAWANIDDGHGPSGERLMLSNLQAVMSNYRAVGMRRFVLAGSFREQAEIDRLRSTLGMPLRVVRLTVPLAVVERRLGDNPTTGRAGDLVVAREAFAAGEGEGLEDLVVDNDRPIAHVASEIVDWLGWL